MLLLLLERRGFVVDDALRGRIESCDDKARLESWFGRAVTAPSLDEVFVD
jgi:hypothetical protein